MSEPATKACTRCRRELALTEFNRSSDGRYGRQAHCRDCVHAYYAANRDKMSTQSAAYYAAVRCDIIARYGGECSCCGERTEAFLAIDHVNNDGATHRREAGIRSGTQMYLWLRRNGYPQEGFQILCHNCNIAKHTRGQCPHFTSLAERLTMSTDPL